MDNDSSTNQCCLCWPTTKFSRPPRLTQIETYGRTAGRLQRLVMAIIMNRRDALMSAVAATPLASALIAGEPLQDSDNLPLVIVHTQMRLTAEQRQSRQSELSAAGNAAGCRVLFVCGCDGVAIPSAVSNAKYGFNEALNGYSVSGFFQTIDELREWFPPTIAKGEQSLVASHAPELDG